MQEQPRFSVDISRQGVQVLDLSGVKEHSLFLLQLPAPQQLVLFHGQQPQRGREESTLGRLVSSCAIPHALSPVPVADSFLLQQLVLLPDEEAVALVVLSDGHQVGVSVWVKVDQLDGLEVLLALSLSFVLVGLEGGRVLVGVDLEESLLKRDIQPDTVHQHQHDAALLVSALVDSHDPDYLVVPADVVAEYLLVLVGAHQLQLACLRHHHQLALMNSPACQHLGVTVVADRSCPFGKLVNQREEQLFFRVVGQSQHFGGEAEVGLGLG